ncbi:MAG: nicotinate (nicotinamide) nucleotide adenylyltransferase [Endomicrobium sp.]|jgi:nicotinate-nucleotide adenylyltransferase|nr:nicotinate (nicotinamide) nucleotide adenylyltransferase [Endomicrobium sp.]
MSKIAIFGGSFDPVHRSHIQLVKFVLELSCNFKKVIFVIAYTSPHKSKQYANVDDRIAMLKIATEGLPRTEISLYEVLKKKVIYSYQTLDYFQSLYPGDEIYMIIGSDSLLELHTWKNIDYLASRYKFVVVKRPYIKIKKDVKYLDRCIIVQNETENISSTEIRQMIKEDSKKFELFLDKKVYNYIVKRRLYK